MSALGAVGRVHETEIERRQINAMWVYLGKEEYTDYVDKQALIKVDSYGGAINRPLRDTAVRQRDSILEVQYQVYWTEQDPHEAAHLAWIRDTYRTTFAAPGGVPVGTETSPTAAASGIRTSI